jgi:hypothetical protein
MAVFFKTSSKITGNDWTTGSGGFSTPLGNFSANENGDENARVVGTDPWGNSAVVWETRPSGNGNPDGGWNTDWFYIDNTKLYRHSVWVKRTSSSAGGTFYLGTNGIGQCVIRLSDGNEECNPYWHCGGSGGLTQDQWYLVVGHCFPFDYPQGLGGHPDTGFWTTTGGKVAGINGCNIGADCKSGPSTYGLNHRTYLYYCADNTTRLQFFDPRVDLCDGSEPTIQNLLDNNRQNKLESLTINTSGSSFKHHRVIATGGVITEVGEWRVHRFNSSGTFAITSTADTSLLEVEYLIVAGGGGGGADMGGGGGGGGLLTGLTVLTQGSYAVVVGAGGAGAPAATGGHPTVRGTNGGDSTFNGLTSVGGGWGGVAYNTQGLGIHFGGSGGSGGGSSGYNNDFVPPGTYGSGAGTAGQGFRGGFQGNAYYSGGGGGAGGAGTDGNNRADGGTGKLVGILGRPFYWAGGGGGAGYSTFGGAGGRGGGGAGAPNEFVNNYARGGRDSIEWGRDTLNGCIGCWTNLPGGNGGTNTGGGGGGGAHYNSNNQGGNGGSGIVIIRYRYK